MAYDVATLLWVIGIPLVFIGVVVYVFRPGARRRYKQDAKIPFEQDEDKRLRSSLDSSSEKEEK